MGENRGFTLVELLVVIAVIAILAVIGLTVFSGIQRNARDSRRKADINAIAKALEVNKGTATYIGLQNSQFAGGIIPEDTTVEKYCIAVSTTTTPALPQTWTKGDACPTVVIAPFWNTITGGSAQGSPFWIICANLEGGGYYCKQNSQ